MRRYVVIGAGAVGGTIAARLAQAGHPTVVVARGEHGAAITARGLTLHTPEGPVVTSPKVWAGPQDAALRPHDILVLAVKTQDAPAALADWSCVPVDGGRAGAALPILICLNGVAAESMALRYFRRVVGVCVWAPTSLIGPGEVASFFAERSGAFHLGRYPSTLQDGDDARLLAGIQEDWQSAHLDVHLPDNVMAWKYRKLVGNLRNAFDALVGEPGGGCPAASATAREGKAILAAAGVPIIPEEVDKQLRAAGPRPAPITGIPNLGSSSRQSLTRRSGTTEVDWLNGEIVALAHAIGATAPLNAAICAIVRDAAARGAQPGDLTADDLATLLGLPGEGA